MTTQASVLAPADAAIAGRVAQERIAELEAQVVAKRKEIDGLCALVGTETPIAAFDFATTWRAEKAALMQECAELRASAELAITRWKRSEAVRRAAIDNVCEQGLVIEELEAELATLRATLTSYRAALCALVASWREEKEGHDKARATVSRLAKDLHIQCERFDLAMEQIRDAHNALSAAGVPSEPHKAHDGCTTQLGHRIRAFSSLAPRGAAAGEVGHE